MSHIYCQECGFQNEEAANYCSRCGALLPRDESGVESTQTFTPEEGAPETADALEELGVTGPALVVRSGGGRAGETFHPEGDSTTIGRSPDCGIFLDDVTVSRRHAVLVERDGAMFIEDQGSLNGTFVNRKRVESARLEDGDEVQVGKYRMTFLNR
jgi:FHA domain/zinc-ribbon domain